MFQGVSGFQGRKDVLPSIAYRSDLAVPFLHIYAGERRNNLSPLSPEPAHTGAEGAIADQDTVLPQALTDTLQRMPGF
jgi:hypothetical protein